MKLFFFIIFCIQINSLRAMEEVKPLPLEDNAWVNLDAKDGFYLVDEKDHKLKDIIKTAHEYNGYILQGSIKEISSLCLNKNVKGIKVNKIHSSFVEFSKEVLKNSIPTLIDNSDLQSDVLCTKIISSILEINKNGNKVIGPIESVSYQDFILHVTTNLVNRMNRPLKVVDIIGDSNKIAQLIRERRAKLPAPKSTKRELKSKLLEKLNDRFDLCSKSDENTKNTSCETPNTTFHVQAPNPFGKQACIDFNKEDLEISKQISELIKKRRIQNQRERIAKEHVRSLGEEEVEFNPKNPYNINPALLSQAILRLRMSKTIKRTYGNTDLQNYFANRSTSRKQEDGSDNESEEELDSITQDVLQSAKIKKVDTNIDVGPSDIRHLTNHKLLERKRNEDHYRRDEKGKEEADNEFH